MRLPLQLRCLGRSQRYRAVVLHTGLFALLWWAGPILISPVQAQCPEGYLCGDGNASGTVTSADVINLLHYTRGTGTQPIPSFECSDVDDFDLVTMRDVLWLARSVFQTHETPTCNPTHPAVVPVATTDYYFTYSGTFPANDTVFWLDLSITAKPGKTIRGMHLPFQIHVAGVAPTLLYDSVRIDLDSTSWTYRYKILNPTGTGPSDLRLEFQRWSVEPITGTVHLASVRLKMPASAAPRPITLKWTSFHPIESGQPTGYPMLCDDTLGTWLPFGLGTVAGTSVLAGRVYNDVDDDCNQSPGEPGLGSQVVRLMPHDIATLTDDSGFYAFDNLSPGVYTVETIPSMWSALTCTTVPSAYTKSLGTQTEFSDLDFALDLQPVWDLSPEVAMTPSAPGSEVAITAMCRNVGASLTPPVDVELVLPPGTVFSHSESVAAGPGTYSPGSHSVTWNLAALAPGESQTERFRAFVTVPANTPAGTPLCATATASPMTGDADSSNNVSVCCDEVALASVSNAKRVSPQGTGLPGFISRDDTLRYHIDFQNTGPDTVVDIVLTDVLDLNLDITTVQPGITSHPGAMSIAGRDLTWTFSNILLPNAGTDSLASRGFVEFTARPSELAFVGEAIPNAAEIRFDSDPPVLTNTVTNAICPTATPGDVDASGSVTSGDVIYLVNAVFKSGPPPMGALGDIDCNLATNAADIIVLVNYVFKSGPPPCTPC